ALQNELEKLTPLATGLELQVDSSTGYAAGRGLPGSDAWARRAERRERAVRGLGERLGFVGPPVVTHMLSRQAVTSPRGFTSVRLTARTDALAHVRILERTSGPGVWISDRVAAHLRVRPGDRLELPPSRGFGMGPPPAGAR